MVYNNKMIKFYISSKLKALYCLSNLHADEICEFLNLSKFS